MGANNLPASHMFIPPMAWTDQNLPENHAAPLVKHGPQTKIFSLEANPCTNAAPQPLDQTQPTCSQL